MTKKILAVDIGYSNLKVAKTTAATEGQLASYIRGSQEERKGIDIDFDMSVMPAGALPKSSMPDDAFGTSSKGVNVDVDGEQWVAGIRVTTNAKIRRHLTPDYKRSKEWKALLNAALAKAEWGEIDLLVLGLPCNEVYGSKVQELPQVLLELRVYKYLNLLIKIFSFYFFLSTLLILLL